MAKATATRFQATRVPKDGKMNTRSADAIDLHVGRRIQQRRKAMGVPQHYIADRLGLSYQQIQKYEKGSNRLSASRLYFIAKILGVPITYFFDGVAPFRKLKGTADELFPNLKDIPSEKVEDALRDLIDSLTTLKK